MRIIPANGALGLRRVVVRALIEKIGGIARHEKSVREAGRHPQHMPVLGREFRADPLAKRRCASPQIDSHIEHGAADDAHEFSLRLLDLIVQAAQRVPNRAAVIVLNEVSGDSAGGEFAPLP